MNLALSSERWRGLPVTPSSSGDSTSGCDRNMDIVPLEHPAQIRLVHLPGAQPFQGGFLAAKGLQESVGKLDWVERLLGQGRDGFFDLDGIIGAD